MDAVPVLAGKIRITCIGIKLGVQEILGGFPTVIAIDVIFGISPHAMIFRYEPNMQGIWHTLQHVVSPFNDFFLKKIFVYHI